ncbi:MAG: ATP-binding protein [Acidimicrobiia bacterium]|nr:ATP-binding protein [Acidimicrobiia bacterium]
MNAALNDPQADGVGATGFPEPSLVVLVGPIASGKSTWAKARFRSNEIVSLAQLQAAVGQDEYDLGATKVAYELLERIVEARLDRRLTVVIDSDGLEERRRSRWLAAAESRSIAAFAVLFRVDVETCLERDAARPNSRPPSIITRQAARCGEIRPSLERQGFVVREVSTLQETDQLP